MAETSMDRLKRTFTELFVNPLLNGPPPLEAKIVEFFDTKEAGTAKEAEGPAAIANMVVTVASKLKTYKTHREAFKTIVFDTGHKPRNIDANALPFAEGEFGNTLFNELVTCCYEGPNIYDCSKVEPSGFYGVYTRKNPGDADIEGLVTKIMGKFPVATDLLCDEYAGLLETQQNEAAQQLGGRRTRRRRGRKGKGTRKH